jgi:dipeptidase E
MKFYLSSDKLGNQVNELKKLISLGNKKTAYITNALDFTNDLERRKKSEQSDITELEKLCLKVERIDLTDYFNNTERLKKKIAEFNVIWVRGGNLFVLRQAMKKSGFDKILKNLKEKDNLLYGGYSAGICVLAPTLKGIDIMDDLNVKPYGRKLEIIWQGLGLIDYSIVPHYRSDHFESAKAEKVVKYMIENKILFKALRDGEVIIIE